jgi:hypothetical protein
LDVLLDENGVDIAATKAIVGERSKNRTLIRALIGALKKITDAWEQRSHR